MFSIILQKKEGCWNPNKRIVTHDEHWQWLWPELGKKRWVLHNSRPCY